MVPRLTGARALVGGVAWLVKVALIWGNSGTNTTEGLVGILFSTGAIAIALAACLRAWHSPSANRLWSRVAAVLLALAAFVAAVNLPILAGWQIFGRTWFAEEVGVLVTALLAMLLGQQWLRFGFRAPQEAQRFAWPSQSRSSNILNCRE